MALLAVSVAVLFLGGTGGGREAKAEAAPVLGDQIVVAYNDLGMHCMNEDFSELCILPPFNTLRATVIDRTDDPNIVTSGVTLEYSIPGNTVSHTKTNFWDYTQSLFGVTLPPDIGLTGNGLTGVMTASPADHDWVVTGIPVTPLTDALVDDPFQLAQVIVRKNGIIKDITQNVIPVSWEIHCDSCHVAKNGKSPATDILERHDRKHGTDLIHQKPVLCARCHADPALGTSGEPGVPSMSAAMHSSHAKRPYAAKPAALGNDPLNTCYSCHPGTKTQCMRDVHLSKGMDCVSCHGNMKAVGNPNRRPWVDEPRCGSCHNVPGHQYEQAGKLFRDSFGHKGVKCVVCHNSPHAIVPTVTERDNVQMQRLQGHPGTLDTCSVCHREIPDEPFFHKVND
ncbi:MAG: cytochrome c3 family protein [Armatimonadetes bacterium]|nr:cytochrome c3 family protein [Armatimonadota bacterium]